MSHVRDIIIQQMFEDFENTAFNVSSQLEFEEKSNQHKSKLGVKQKRKSIAGHDVISALKTAQESSKHHSSTSHIISSPKSKSSRLNSFSSSVTDQLMKFPISNDVALYLYRNKLTPHEHQEIQNYENIYFLGLQAEKIYVPKRANMELYDDEDSYYRAVPRDQVAYRYEVLEKPYLGKGTFAQVVKAYDHKNKKAVAIKIVRNERVYLQQSREELRILQLLRKRDTDRSYNLVHIYDFFMFRSHMCITFELLGMNLYEVLVKNNFRGIKASKIQQVARCVLKCLELLYRSRIIHCDIKPENLMLKYNGDFSSVKVGDFGSSCYEQQQVYHYVQSRYYRAPEVILGLRYGPAIDMWSLGCVLGELSNGYPIFVGKNEVAQLAAIEEVMGGVPDAMLVRSKFRMSRLRANPGTKSFSSVVIGDENFRDMIRQMLEWDPQVRPSPLDVQDHVWVKQKGRNDLSSAATGKHHGQIKKSHSVSSGSIATDSRG